MDKILLFIPCYNCQEQVIRTLNQLDSNVMQFISEVIVIDNQSTDKTLEVACSYSKEHPELRIKILRNQDNYNLGGSHKVAFKYAVDNNFDYIIVLHGDDQASINDILPIIKNNFHKEVDCCLGARFQHGSKLYGYSKFRIFGNIVFNIIFSILLFKKIYDLGSGLNMYNVKILNDEFYMKFPDALTFNYCMILAADFYHHKMMFFPISWRENDQISNVKMMSQAMSVLSMLMKYFIFRKSFIQKDLRQIMIKEYKSKEPIRSFNK